MPKQIKLYDRTEFPVDVKKAWDEVQGEYGRSNGSLVQFYVWDGLDETGNDWEGEVAEDLVVHQYFKNLGHAEGETVYVHHWW